MKLMTKEIEKKLPALYANENNKPEDTPIVVKFFDAYGNWAWYATEGEKQEDGDWLFFGWVFGTDPELGYFTLNELASLQLVPGVPRIERDMYFGEHMLSEVMEKQRI